MYIAIAGNIGSGKTTLTQILTKRYDAKCYLEECDNPYIGDFYEDMNRWAFNLQISFLGSRIQQTMGMDLRLQVGGDLPDRTIYEDAHLRRQPAQRNGADGHALLIYLRATSRPT